MTNKTESEQKVILFNFERVINDGVEKIYFHLDNYPTIRFSYENVRFGTPDEDQLVPVMFDLDFAKIAGLEEVIVDENFEDQVKGLLVYLLQEANNKALEVINSPSTKSDTN